METKKRSIDMLSGLPDEVLCHILSFLPTKTSLSTSVLAKRWRFLWAHVPNLQFDIRNFRVGSETQPLEIISRVLMLHESKIVNTFKLFKVRGSAYQLLTLIIYPIKHGVRNLYLDFDFRGHDILCTLPRLLFTCKTFVDLELVCCGVIPSGGELFLPSLKKLNLRYVEYENDDSLPHLLSGCPVLEELRIHDTFRKEQKNSGCVIVASPTIKKLNVSISQGLEHYPDELLIIDVPALVYLEVNDCPFGHAKSLRKTMTSLIEAKFNFSGKCACGIDCTEQVRSVEFLSYLCHVKYLKIQSGYHETPVLLVGTCSMVKFVNLTKLELYMISSDWYDVVKFLEVADNLEVLFMTVYAKLPYKEPEQVPTCMLSSLRTVVMNSFYACQDASFDKIRYVLRNALVLEMMEIDPERHISNKNKLHDALRRISLFERGSKSCQVAFNTVSFDDVVVKRPPR